MATPAQMSPRSLFQPALALVLAGLLSAQASVFEGAPGTLGDVVVFALPGAVGRRPAELQGIQLLPVDATGRANSTQFLPGQPRLKNDVPLASRLLLPEAQGSLYRYRKPSAFGSDFGFFLVRPDGLAEPLAVFQGTGPGGHDDPIPSPVAVSALGDSLLVATTLAAGGDVYEIELSNGRAHRLTKKQPPLEVLTQGLILLETWGAVLTQTGPFRFTRGGGRLSPVDLRPTSRTGRLGRNRGGTPALGPLRHFGNGMARSADGSTVAVIAGTQASRAHVFTFGLAGAPTCVNEVPAFIVDPGYGTEGAPQLALSPDGGRVAWKTSVGSGEVFSRRVPVNATPLEVQITGDLHFGDTLNDTGVLAFFDRESIVMLVGESNGVGGVEKGDLYRARFPSNGGAPVFSNLSNTSGDGAVPFLAKGGINACEGLYVTPERNGLLYYASAIGGEGFLHHVDGATGSAKTLRSGLGELTFVERAGSDFVVGVQLEARDECELIRVPIDHALPSAILGVFPKSEAFSSHAGSPAGVFAGLLTMKEGERLVCLSLPDDTTIGFPGIWAYGPTLGFDGAGRVLASLGNTVNTHFFSLTTSGVESYYGKGPLDSIVLPGN